MKSKPIPSGLFVGTLLVFGAILVRATATPAPISDSTSSSHASTTVERGFGPSTTPASQAVGSFALDPALPPEEPSPDECAIWYGTTERMALPVEQWASSSTSVVRATVADVGDTQWNTPDGNAPAGRQAESSDFMRLIKLAPTDTLKGQLSSTTAWIPGGTIGCLTFIVDEYDVKIGQEYLFFMQDLDPATGLKGALRARLMLPIQPDGTVATPAEGKLSIVDIGKRITGT